MTHRGATVMSVLRALPCLLLFCLLFWAASASRPAFSQAPEEAPQDVPLCQLLADPQAYDKKLVRVTGIVTRGFESFSLRAPACSDAPTHIWLEYGGPEPADVVYCCVTDESAKPNGKDPLRVDGIETSLVRDKTFNRFDRLSQRDRRLSFVSATLIGRYFCGDFDEGPDGHSRCGGFGHFGLSSLLVIQQVISVRRAHAGDLPRDP